VRGTVKIKTWKLTLVNVKKISSKSVNGVRKIAVFHHFGCWLMQLQLVERTSGDDRATAHAKSLHGCRLSVAMAAHRRAPVEAAHISYTCRSVGATGNDASRPLRCLSLGRRRATCEATTASRGHLRAHRRPSSCAGVGM